jgi:hypothetical protein
MWAVHLLRRRWRWYSQSTVGPLSLRSYLYGCHRLRWCSCFLTFGFSSLRGFQPLCWSWRYISSMVGACHIVAVATFASGFAATAPCWSRCCSCRDSLGWHHVALIVVVGLVAGVVVLLGVRAVVIAGIHAVGFPRCLWRSRRHHPGLRIVVVTGLRIVIVAIIRVVVATRRCGV